MKNDIYFLNIPVPYQVEYIKKGCRKSQISTIIENIEVPIKILPDDLKPIATLTHANVGNHLTEYDYQERIRKGDYLFLEYQDELYTTYIDFFEKSNSNTSHFYPMNNNIFREDIERINGEGLHEIKSFLKSSNKNKTSQIINEYMESMGLICNNVENYIQDIPNDSKVISDNKDSRVANILEQVKDWRVFRNRLYLATYGLNCYIKFSNNDEKISLDIQHPNLKNPIYQKHKDKQFIEYDLKHSKTSKIPLFMALSFIENNVDGLIFNITRNTLNIHNLEQFLSYEQPNIFLNSFIKNLDHIFSNGMIFDLNTSIEKLTLFSELCKFKQKGVNDISDDLLLDELILMNKNIEDLIQRQNYSSKQLTLFKNNLTNSNFNKNRSFSIQKDQQQNISCFFDTIDPMCSPNIGISQ